MNPAELQQNFARIFEGSPVMMAVTDRRTGVALDCNPAFCGTTGFARHEVVGKVMSDLPLWDHAQVRREHLEALGESIVVPEFEFGYWTKDRRQRWARGTFTVIRYSGKDCVLASAMDITAEYHLRELLADQSRLKDRLFTVLAHDLRGPVGTLSTLLGLILPQAAEGTDLREALDTAYRSAGQAYNLLENLLGWVQAQRQGIADRSADELVEPQLAQVLGWLQAQAESKGIRLTLQVPPDLRVYTDPEAFQTIVRNLVSNAVKYSSAGAEVVVTARGGPGGPIVEVIDHGTGMPAQKRMGLFGEDRVDSRPGTCGEAGHGLGLMFSADLARSLGGCLSVESEEGRGSTFTFQVAPAPAMH